MNDRVVMPKTIPEMSFRRYLLSSRRNKIVLCITAATIIIQFIIFKYYYPYASYIHGDSFVYLDIAHNNSDIEAYMVGYGRFLRLFSVFASSDIALVAFQYLLIQGSVLYMLFSLFYFYNPGKLTKLVLMCFMVLNPLFLYLANLISSDGLFLALSMLWFTLLLHIIHMPSIRLIVWHTLVLFIAFTVRYNALIYPIVSVFVIFFTNLPTYKRIVGIGMAVIFCGLFMLYTTDKYKSLTGIWQYSPFSGWLMANNAMYAYRYVDSAHRKAVPAKFKDLDNMIRTYFDTTRDTQKHPEELAMASTMYMWSPDLPLYKFRDSLFSTDTTASELKKWASMGEFYKEYGLFIIRKYPLHYAKYFLWPNAMKYYAPPIEFLEFYNSNYDEVTPQAQKWFGYRSTKVSTNTKDFRVKLLDFYPIYSGMINVVIFFAILCFAILKGFKVDMLFKKGLLLGGALWILNATFTIFASPAALRFQSFPIILTTSFTFLIIDYLWKIGKYYDKNLHAVKVESIDSKRIEIRDIVSEEDVKR